ANDNRAMSAAAVFPLGSVLDDVLDDMGNQLAVAVGLHGGDRFARVPATQPEVRRTLARRLDAPEALRTPQRLIVGAQLHERKRLGRWKREATQLRDRRLVQRRRRVRQSQEWSEPSGTRP